MAIPLIKFYNPSEVFRLKRQKALEAPERKDAPVEADAVVEDKSELQITKEHLSEISDGLDSIVEHLNRMTQMAVRGSKGNVPELERRSIAKAFGGALTELNKLALDKSIRGDLLFSGKFDAKPKVFKIEGEEDYEFKTGPLSAEGLGLDRIRLDTAATSTTALGQIDHAVSTVEGLSAQIINRLRNIENREKAAVRAKSNQTASTSQSEDWVMRELKSMQERLALESGQTQGLLINAKM